MSSSLGNEKDAASEGGCNVLAARLRVNAATEIRVLAQEFDGRCYLHIRQYFLGDDNAFLPTQRGVALPVESLDQVLGAVRELREVGTRPGIVSTVEKSPREEVRFSVVTWQGTTKADIRSYFSKQGMDGRQPGKGVRLNLALLAELERALEVLDRRFNG